MRDLAALDADIVFGAQNIVGTSTLLRKLKELDYTPKAAIFRLFNQAIPTELRPLVKYMMDVANFDERLKGSDYQSDLYFLNGTLFNETDPTPKRLAKVVKATFANVTRVLTEPIAFAQGEILERAMLRAQSVKPADIRAAIPLLVFNSVLGRIAFNPFGINDKTAPVTWQNDRNQNLQVISPLGATTARVVYPMPKWDEREQDLSLYSAY